MEETVLEQLHLMSVHASISTLDLKVQDISIPPRTAAMSSWYISLFCINLSAPPRSRKPFHETPDRLVENPVIHRPTNNAKDDKDNPRKKEDDSKADPVLTHGVLCVL